MKPIIEQHSLQSLESWVQTMHRTKVLKQVYLNESALYSLATPVQFELQPNCLKKIIDGYDPMFERGGIFYSKPLSIQKEIRNFSIIDVTFLENMYPLHEQDDNYIFHPSDLYSEVEKCFTYTPESPICYPIVFHTHPTFDIDDIESMIRFFQQSRTSLRDQMLADFKISYKEFNFLVPNALVVINPQVSGQYFVGFFGGQIAPASFEAYMLALTGKTLKEIFELIRDWAAENTGRIIFVTVLSGILLGATVYHASTVIPFLIFLVSLNIIPMARTAIEETSHYFGQIVDISRPKKFFFPK